eukprot:gnl/TRDRNA2_/TRDRNA2_35208_c0_seq1.p1 gnl/TRDRNA2_/TRDRNA2_35208_c0~~gnl/TRDRNA2_/TRDRNA2_35208_c0_seq1.p1  ORF type:complete len:256 (+),score=28.33 gnl/TRDRNA2_/TRDRNA2_35208_c0_seq1:98-865(+)
MLVSRLSRWLVLFLVLMVTAAGTRLLSLRRSQAIHKLQHLNALIRTDLRNETEAEAHINLKAEDYYLFVVVWKMPHPLLKGWAHHSENTWCKVRDFTPAQQRYLDGKVRSIEMTGGGYSDLGVAWKSMQADCEMVGYGNGDHTESCLGTGGSRGSCSGTYESWTTINATKRGGHKKLEAKYIYGRTAISRDQAHNEICECGSKWSVEEYHCTSRNCNTFGASIRGCILGLSPKNPPGCTAGGGKTCCPAGSARSM